jgi:plastocyanin
MSKLSRSSLLCRSVLCSALLSAAACADEGAPGGGTEPAGSGAASTVELLPDCAAITADVVIATQDAALAFTKTAATIPAGGVVKFVSTGFHNFASSGGAPAERAFRSGQLGEHTACLRFTVAGRYPYRCEAHSGMTGVLTVQ